MIAGVTSCTKTTSGNNIYTCSCNFYLVTGVYSRDTIESTTYAAGTSQVDAQVACTNLQNTYLSTGTSTARCLLSD
jgi:hypothetical protein